MIALLEHNATPGTVYEDTLMYGGASCYLNEMVNLNEAADFKTPSIKFRGKFQEAEAVNKNKRLYPREILESNTKRLIETMNGGGLCGELDHPTDSIVHFSNVSHKITKLWWEANNLMGEGVILNTPAGKIVRALINDGVRIGISSRGVGNGKVNENGVLVIGESYKLITFDVVADPSTYAAYQEKVSSDKRESVSHPQNFSTKNESSGIHNISKELVLACVESIMNKQADEIKARMSK